MNLAPSILSFDLTNLKQEISRIEGIEPAVIHLDVMDGQFVPPITFGDSFVKSLHQGCRTPMEAHLMTLTPERHFEAFAEAGCKRIIFHAEATPHAHRLVQQLRRMGLEAGIAINPGTPVETALALVDQVDLILVMTVNPGWGGQEFLQFTLDKVKRIREASSSVHIEVDGGIDPQTVNAARTAGANFFVVGSYFAKAADIKEAAQLLRDAAR